MWALTFKANEKDYSIGFITAVFNAGQPDEFTFLGEVSLESPDSVSDFVNRAKKRQAEYAKKSQIDQKIVDLINNLTTEINKG